MTWLSFGIGLFIGTFLGLLLAGILAMAHRDDDEIEDEIRRWDATSCFYPANPLNKDNTKLEYAPKGTIVELKRAKSHIHRTIALLDSMKLNVKHLYFVNGQSIEAWEKELREQYPEMDQALADLRNFCNSQESLGAEFQKVIDDNLWDLVVKI
ncbi:MAG: hypothetical protein EHM49_09950 [Deltaproteobacteria bacterium]|nr:MAG: hypothetical protein EHM49_09950 [Deltaproteobacteria bacterium]